MSVTATNLTAPEASLDGASPTAALLGDLVAYIGRFVVLTPVQLQVVAVWVMHTYILDACDQTPYLNIRSPEKQSGKTRLLEVLATLVFRPWMVTRPSESVLFRKIERDRPTVLLDEVDLVFAKGDEFLGVQSALNSGTRRGVPVPRTEKRGGSFELLEFEVFCPKALSGIGKSLPDTVADRSIPIVLMRKRPGDQVERFRQKTQTADGADGPVLRDRLGVWAEESVAELEAIVAAAPALPDDLSDRAQDAVEILVAIADLAGGNWPERIRKALIMVLATDEGDDAAEESWEAAALRLTRVVFAERGFPAAVKSADLIIALSSMADSPWNTNEGGQALGPRWLGQMLGTYEVHSKSVRFPDGTRLRGYPLEELQPAWDAYVADGEVPA